MWRRFFRPSAAGLETRSTAIVAVALLLTATVAPTDASGAWQLVWADEFDSDGTLSPADWSFEHGFVRNRELQWYQSDNAFVENGLLIIEGRQETIRNSKHDSSSSDWRRSRKLARYTSASINTKGRHSWRYGRFEIRARIRAEEGLWPAIWFLGVDGGWPSNGEIDLMEFYAGDILANAAWGRPARSGGKPIWNATRTPVESFGADWADEFHTWRMDWNASSIKLYVDDQLLNTIDVNAAVNPPGVEPRYPFRQPHYLLLNLAIGGQGGNPEGTPFPTRYEIDYVRVYQRYWTGIR